MQLKARARRSLLHARSVACCVPCGLTFARFAVHAARGGERPPGGARAGAGARQRRCRASSRCEAKQPPWRGGSAAALTRPPPAAQAAPVISEHWVAAAEGATQRWCAAALQPLARLCALPGRRRSPRGPRAPQHRHHGGRPQAGRAAGAHVFQARPCRAACMPACRWLDARASALKRASPRAETTPRRRKSCTRRRRLAPPRRRVRPRCVAPRGALFLRCHCPSQAQRPARA